MSWLTLIEKQLKNPLPGENAHQIMAPSHRLGAKEAKEKAVFYRESSVAIHVLEQQSELSILLTQRSAYDGAHSGQVSFPGGKIEPSDSSVLHAARRESFEETGIPIHEGLFLGTLTNVFIPVSSFDVQVHLLYHSEINWEFKKNDREVAEIFWLPASRLLDDSTTTLLDISISPAVKLKNVPCYVYENKIIWGATAIILSELKVILQNGLKENNNPQL